MESQRENHSEGLEEQKMDLLNLPIIPELPNDIILFNIFIRLPVKSLIRFKCVCKQWRNLLSDPQFAKLHLNHITKDQSPHIPQKLLLISSSNEFHSVDYEASNGNGDANAARLDFPLKIRRYPSTYMEFLGSCNGLVCIAARHRTNVQGDNDMFLWNPSTGDYKMLPDPNPPIDAYHILGFGYDPSLDDYKMVRVISKNCWYRPDIYTLKSNSWKILPRDDAYDNNVFWSSTHPRQCAAVNGSIYWVGCRSSTSSYCTDLVVGFDLKDDKFREVPVPRDLHKGVSTYLKVMGGCLCIVKFYNKSYTEVWTMKENGWIKLLLTISYQDYRVARYMQPVCIMKNGKVLMFYKEEFNRKKFVVYDPKTNSIFGNISILGCDCLEPTTYIESLVSPNAGWGRVNIQYA